jgi:shikimate kinase
MSTALIGYRGCGKSTVGKRLADRLWTKFVDTDELVVKKAGKTIKRIFEEDGEDAFRDLEVEVVAEVCKLEDHVIALGGGAVLREENRQAIKDAGLKVIYLKCDPAELHRRIQADPTTVATRPALTDMGGTVEEIRKLLEEREPIYRAMKTGELEVTHLSPQDAVVYVTRLM